MRRDLANKSTEFPQLGGGPQENGECLKFAQQVGLLYKLDVIYLKSISNDVSNPSAEKIMQVDMYQKSMYMYIMYIRV